MPHLRGVDTGQAADHGRERGRPGAPLDVVQRLVARPHGAEGMVPPSGRSRRDELLGSPDDREGPLLRLGRGVAPGGDAVAAQDAADGLRVRGLDGRDVEAELETRTAPGHPDDLVAEDLGGQVLAVGGRGDRDAGVGVQVVHVGRVDQAVHGRVDRGRRAALAVQAVVERGDHLVLALLARVHVHEGAHPVEPQHGEALLGERAEVAAGALDPQQLDGLARHRVGGGALRGRVAARVVGHPRVGAQAVGPAHQVLYRTGRAGTGLDDVVHAPHPACAPPTRSCAIFSA